jgi:hypothetical protein
MDDAEFRALEKELAAEGVDRAYIQRQIAELNRFRDFLAEAERDLGVDSANAIYWRDVIKDRLGRFPRLTKLITFLERKGLGAELGKVIDLATSTAGLVFLEVLLYAPDSGGAAYGEFELVDTIPITKSTGDEFFCAVLCVYHGPTHVIVYPRDPLTGESYQASHPYSGKDTHDFVSVHQYDCSRPPTEKVLQQFCRRAVYREIAS